MPSRTFSTHERMQESSHAAHAPTDEETNEKTVEQTDKQIEK